MVLGLLLGASVQAGEPSPAPTSSLPAVEPQRVVLLDLAAFATGDQVLVRWESGLEVGVISFDLYRVEDGRRFKVNPEPVLASGEMSGARYFLRDGAARAQATHRYELEAFLITGRSVLLASRELTATVSAPGTDLPQQGAEPRLAVTRLRETERERRVALAAASAPVDLPNSSARVKITTSSNGIHFVSAASLASLLAQDLASVETWIETGRVALSNLGLDEANRWVACWGGYLDRKHDGPPGPESLGIGLHRLYDVTFGWRLAREAMGSR